MQEPIKVFHVNDEKYKYMSKSGPNGCYKKFQFAWGGVITNKHCRTKKEFATLLCPNGTRAHKINHETFKHFFCGRKDVVHIYLEEGHLCKLADQLKSLPKEAYQMVIDKVNESPCHDTEDCCEKVPQNIRCCHYGCPDRC